MNSKHRNIKFTFETENSNNFLFLDDKINQKIPKDLLIQFFAKPQLMEFLLITIVLFLIPRRQVQFTSFCAGFSKFVPVLKISYRSRTPESIFKCNSYPVNIIDQCIKKFLDKLYVPKHIVPTVPKKLLLVFLPYLATIFFEFRKTLV